MTLEEKLLDAGCEDAIEWIDYNTLCAHMGARARCTF